MSVASSVGETSKATTKADSFRNTGPGKRCHVGPAKAAMANSNMNAVSSQCWRWRGAAASVNNNGNNSASHNCCHWLCGRCCRHCHSNNAAAGNNASHHHGRRK
jgi:hypothetical protein